MGFIVSKNFGTDVQQYSKKMCQAFWPPVSVDLVKVTALGLILVGIVEKYVCLLVTGVV